MRVFKVAAAAAVVLAALAGGARAAPDEPAGVMELCKQATHCGACLGEDLASRCEWNLERRECLPRCESGSGCPRKVVEQLRRKEAEDEEEMYVKNAQLCPSNCEKAFHLCGDCVQHRGGSKDHVHRCMWDVATDTCVEFKKDTGADEAAAAEAAEGNAAADDTAAGAAAQEEEEAKDKEAENAAIAADKKKGGNAAALLELFPGKAKRAAKKAARVEKRADKKAKRGAAKTARLAKKDDDAAAKGKGKGKGKGKEEAADAKEAEGGEEKAKEEREPTETEKKKEEEKVEAKDRRNTGRMPVTFVRAASQCPAAPTKSPTVEEKK